MAGVRSRHFREGPPHPDLPPDRLRSAPPGTGSVQLRKNVCRHHPRSRHRSSLGGPMQWLKQLFSRRRRHNDLSVSIQEHLEEKIEELVEDGTPREEAERIARREYGNRTLIAERSGEAWQWRTPESGWADVRYALRQLIRSPVFAGTVILTMALGIGANTAIFTLVHAILMKSLPVGDPKSLYRIGDRIEASGLTN